MYPLKYPGFAMYLTRRENGYRFQRRIPNHLQQVLGTTPIRINLGHLTSQKAASIARLLASHSDRLFLAITRDGCRPMSDCPDPRDALISDLQQQLVQVTEEAQSLVEVANQTIDTQDRLLVVERKKHELQMLHTALQREDRFKRDLDMLRTSFDEMHELVIKRLKEAKSKSSAAKDEAITLQFESMKQHLMALNESVEASLNGGFERPLMSVALEEWHREIRLKQGIQEKKTDTDYSRLQDFIEFAGDRPVNKYKFFDFQKFKNLLASVPSNYNKIPALRGMAREEAAEYNLNLPPNERLETLSITTIEANYFSPLLVFFQDTAAQHDFKSPLTDVKVRLPRFTKGKKTRQPFTVKELNLWFPIAAKAQRAEMKWMPLLGAVLGARVGELVPLQGKDVYQVEGGVWVIDLTTDLVDDQGDAEKRQLKNTSSRRIIALPDFLSRTGFFDYVKTRRPDDNLFPACFYHGKEQVDDPAGAASKRLNAQLKKVGIHRTLETTFHSTRHTAKDIMRVAKVDERIHDKQTGHSNKTVSRNYGSKILLRQEIEVLRLLPLPEGLDLSPYFVL